MHTFNTRGTCSRQINFDIVDGNVLVILLDLYSTGGYPIATSLLSFSSDAILQGQIWRIITFVFVPATSRNIFLFAITLYFYYFIGNALEREWGSNKFTIFYFFGFLLNILVGFLGGTASMYNVNMSMFFAFATLYPNLQFLLFFIIPVKAKWLAWTRLHDGQVTSSYQKFLTEEENRAILERAGAKDGDLVLIVGDAKDEVVFAALGALRCECAKQLGILDPMDFKFLWVTEFPMFEWSEEEGRYQAMHHPFTAPMDEDLDKLETDKKNCRAKAYDIVLNGTELGGGSIRISVPETQEAMFRALGFTNEDAQERFGHLINAFKFGAPPHGGLAYGLDRLCMLMAGAESIRDVIAFPKVQNASEPMTSCPDFVDDKQLDELNLNVTRREETSDEE